MPSSKRPAENLFAPSPKDDASSHRHRQAIGWLGFALPWLLVASNYIRPYPLTDLPPFWASISLYYYSAGNAFFCGILFALLVFLFTYRGYDNAGRKWDITFGVIAGLAAFGVAYFPTDPQGLQPMPWVTCSCTGKIHLGAAILLFGCFIMFSLFLFTRNAKSQGLFDFHRPKKKRDWVYVICGLVMLGFVIWAIVNQFSGGSIFWQETGALEAFGVSWLVKSRVEYTASKLIKRACRIMAG
jgi:hypothetical protein